MANGQIKTENQLKKDIKKESVFDGIQRRFDQQMYLEDQYSEKDVVATYNPDSGLYRNKIGTVAFRNAVDANKYNESVLGKPVVNTASSMGEYFKNKSKVKPKVKPKETAKPFYKPDRTPVNINYEPSPLEQSLRTRELLQETPEQKLRRENFERILKQSEEEEIIRKTSGLAYLMGSPEDPRKIRKAKKDIESEPIERGIYDKSI